MSSSTATPFAHSKTLTSTHTVQAEIPTSSGKPQGPKSTWSKIRRTIRQPTAEFAGVAVFVIFGAGVDCQVVLSTNKNVSTPKGDFLSVSFGWAIGLAMGAWVAGGISGGHLNPAVTLAMATRRGFPWRKVPGYIFAQVLGGLAGAAMIYGIYSNAIDIFEGGPHIRTRATAGLFATYALDYMTDATCFFVEFLGTAVLAFMVLVATDKKNNDLPRVLLPLTLFLTLLGLGIALGMQTSFAFNPARDFGPRLLLTFAGYGKQLYTYRNQYWLWCPIIAPILGAQAAAGFYDVFLDEKDPWGNDDTSDLANTENGSKNPTANDRQV